MKGEGDKNDEKIGLTPFAPFLFFRTDTFFTTLDVFGQCLCGLDEGSVGKFVTIELFCINQLFH
jgi:hypothetical protein